MKKLQTVSIALIAFIAFSFTSSVKSYKDKIVGTWTIESITFNPDPVAALKAQGKTDQEIAGIKTLLDGMKQGVIENTEITYKVDGTYQATTFDMSSNGAKAESGTWSISEDGKTMTTVDQDGKEESVEIEFTVDNKIKVIDDSSKSMKVILLFVKQ